MRRRAVALLAGCVIAGYLLLSVGESMAPQDIPLPKRALPAGALQVVALGTSLTQNGVWPDRLAQDLTACLGADVIVTRVARAGASSDWGVGQVAAVAARMPDLVLVEFAVNDADLFDGVALGRSDQNLRAIVAALRESRPGVAVVLMSTNPARGLRRWQRPFLGRYSDVPRGVAAAEGVGFFDGRSRWLNDLHATDLPDGLHPAAAAEARVIVPALAAYIARSFGRDCA